MQSLCKALIVHLSVRYRQLTTRPTVAPPRLSCYPTPGRPAATIIDWSATISLSPPVSALCRFITVPILDLVLIARQGRAVPWAAGLFGTFCSSARCWTKVWAIELGKI